MARTVDRSSLISVGGGSEVNDMWQYYLISRHFAQDRLREAEHQRMAAEARRARPRRTSGTLLGRTRGRGRAG
ncbi:MAG: hypothetical protein ACXWO7_03910 [Candidatus Limnocylindrales bacterium]